MIASDGKSGEQKDIQYTNCKVIGNGSFGVVFQARMLSVPKEEEDIAIKKVLQDKRFKVGLVSPNPPLCPRPSKLSPPSAVLTRARQNRELQIMRLVSHPNVVDLRSFFYSNGDKVRTAQSCACPTDSR